MHKPDSASDAAGKQSGGPLPGFDAFQIFVATDV